MRIIRDILYCAESGQKLNVYLPESEAFSVLVYFHGGGLEAGSKEAAECFAEYLTQHNIALVSADYRMYPNAAYPDFLEDSAAAAAWAYEHMKEYGKCSRFFLSGSSAGGYITMMLCFDKPYLAKYGLKPTDFTGFIHDAGQPTSHFNVLREKGLDTRRVIVDETAPLYHIGTSRDYPKMLFIVSDQDMTNRYEQTMLTLSTLRHFGFGEEKVSLKVMHGGHCHYIGQTDEQGLSVFGQLLAAYINE